MAHMKVVDQAQVSNECEEKVVNLYLHLSLHIQMLMPMVLLEAVHNLPVKVNLFTQQVA